MSTVTASVRINAPREVVFDLFTDFRAAVDRIEEIEHVDMLTDGPVGMGTRFAETRKVFGKSQTVTLEVIDWQPQESYAVECESAGMRYRTEFRFQPDGDATIVESTVTNEPLTFAARLMCIMVALMKSACRKMLEKDMAQLKAVAEGAGAVPSASTLQHAAN